MPRPLTITSTTNAHALTVYAAIAILGGVFTFTGTPKPLLQFPEHIATALSGLLMFAGLVAFSAALVASKRRDPSMGLAVEMVALGVLSVALMLYLIAVVGFYGSTAPTAVTLTGAYTVGCVLRLVQVTREYLNLCKARQQRIRRTVEVAADPVRE